MSAPRTKPAQLPLPVRLRDSSVFTSYFAGRNQPVVDALRSLETIRSSAHQATTCLWVHGPASSGKTHLLQACCARGASRGQAVAYLPLRTAAATGEELLGGYEEFALVCLDDADAIAGRGGWERALFRLHQQLDERGGRLVISGSVPPAALGFQLRDLASRLNGGLVLSLQALDERERIAALQLRAQLRGFELPEDTALFLLRRLPRDMKSLCAFLDALDEASLAAQRRLTTPFVRRVMEERGIRPA